MNSAPVTKVTIDNYFQACLAWLVVNGPLPVRSMFHDEAPFSSVHAGYFGPVEWPEMVESVLLTIILFDAAEMELNTDVVFRFDDPRKIFTEQELLELLHSLRNIQHLRADRVSGLVALKYELDEYSREPNTMEIIGVCLGADAVSAFKNDKVPLVESVERCLGDTFGEKLGLAVVRPTLLRCVGMRGDESIDEVAAAARNLVSSMDLAEL